MTFQQIQKQNQAFGTYYNNLAASQATKDPKTLTLNLGNLIGSYYHLI